MPQATKSKAPKSDRERSTRVQRGQREISELLQRENLTLTINRIQIFVKEADKLVPAGELTPAVLARMCGLPEGTMLFPRVELQANPSKNGA